MQIFGYQSELLFVVKFYQQHKLEKLFSGKGIVGIHHTYSVLAEPLQFNCTDRKLRAPKIEYYNSENNLIYLATSPVVPELDAKPASPFDALLHIICGAPILAVQGRYEGKNTARNEKGIQAEDKIVIIVEQTGSKVTVSFQTASGRQGKGEGTLTGDTVKSISLQSTEPNCPGSYEASLKFASDTVSWSYKGQACGGAQEGHGTAKRMNS